MTTYDMTKNDAKKQGSAKRTGTRNKWGYGMEQKSEEIKEENKMADDNQDDTDFEMHPEDAYYANGGEVCPCCGSLNCRL